MLVRPLLILLSLIALERAASACCVGCPCPIDKSRRFPGERKVTIVPATGYTHASKGSVPKFSHAAIAKFLQQTIWEPTFEEPATATTPYILPSSLQFMTAAQIESGTVQQGGEIILIRRIEKRGKAILVEVNDRVLELVACAGKDKKGHACLVPTKLSLARIPRPGAK